MQQLAGSRCRGLSHLLRSTWKCGCLRWDLSLTKYGMSETVTKNDRAFLDDGTMTKGNDHRDLVLVHVDVLLRMGTALFVVLSPDGTLLTR
jgi:hypothetical protein